MDRAISFALRSVDLATEPAFQLGCARVDPQAHEYTIDGRSTHLQPQTVKVLVALHDKLGQVVTRDELVDRCWNGRIVGDDVINRCISLLRHVADETRSFRIETVPRAGYRLVEAGAAAVRKRAPRLAVVAGTLTLVMILVSVSAWIWMGRTPIKQGLPPAPSITVVPFTVDAGDPIERQVADGAPVSISHMLSQSGLPIVLAHSRSDDTSKSDFVISGNVHRADGGVDVTVQMNATSDGTMVFSHDFEAKDASSADLPDQIGAVFACDLAWTGGEMVLDRRHPLDRQIASELMNAVTLTVEHSDILRAYQITRRIAPMAPDSAITQLTFAVETGFSIRGIPPEDRAAAVNAGRRAAARALVLAPEFGDVYIPGCNLHSPVRMSACENRLRRAMQIDPSSSFVPGYLGSLLFSGGRLDEAVEFSQVSLANDPYKPAKLARMIQMLEIEGRADEAESLFKRASRLWPDNRVVRTSRLVGMVEGANLQGVETILADSPTEGSMLDANSVAALSAAVRGHDVGRARKACARPGLKPAMQPLCMTGLASVGDVNDAFAIAGRLYPTMVAKTAAEEDAIWLANPDTADTAYLTLPASASMRSDPRFIALAERVGLLDYWRSGHLPDFCTKAHEPECAQIASR